MNDKPTITPDSIAEQLQADVQRAARAYARWREHAEQVEDIEVKIRQRQQEIADEMRLANADLYERADFAEQTYQMERQGITDKTLELWGQITPKPDKGRELMGGALKVSIHTVIEISDDELAIQWCEQAGYTGLVKRVLDKPKFKDALKADIFTTAPPNYVAVMTREPRLTIQTAAFKTLTQE
jgi:hypothetical protein